MPHLLIIGANGVLGNAAASHFLEKGYRVTAFVRDKAKAAELERKGAAVLVGDLTKPLTLTGIFNGVDIVLTAAHGMLGKGGNKSEKVDNAGHKLLIDEAKKSGVRQFIYTSVSTAAANHPVDFFRTKYLVEQYLIRSGLNYTILKLPAFMEWHAYHFLGKNIIEKGKVSILGAGKNPVNFIAVKDIVSALDKIAGDETYYNKTIPLAGPDNISRNEVAGLFEKAVNRKARIGHVPVAILKVMAVLFKPFNPGIARIMKFSVYTDKSDETMNPQHSIRQFGLNPTSLEEFIQSVVSKK